MAVFLAGQAAGLQGGDQAVGDLGQDAAAGVIGGDQEAIAALRQGEAADPNDFSIPYARATIHARLGQRNEALQAATSALQNSEEDQHGEARGQPAQDGTRGKEPHADA